MTNGLCREFSSKSKDEQDDLFRALPDAPVESFGGILIHDHEASFYSYGSDHQECMVHIERHLRDSMENEKNLTWNRQMLELIQEMIHANNTATEGIGEEKIAGFEAKYDAIVQTATKEYEDEPPSDYYRDGYNLYLRMVEYKHNHLLFLSNPLVYFCECLSVLDHFATNSEDNLYQSVKGVFKRPKPIQPKSEKSEPANTTLSECKAGWGCRTK